MIQVIFWMPSDKVLTFLCFISDNRWTCPDRVGQTTGLWDRNTEQDSVGGGIIEKKNLFCLKMLFSQFQVFLANVFFFLFENRPSLKCYCADPLPLLFEFSNNFFFETFPQGNPTCFFSQKISDPNNFDQIFFPPNIFTQIFFDPKML